MPPSIPGVGTRVQGKYYDYSSIEITLGPLGVCLNISDVSYSQKLDPGVFRGTGAKIRGRTRGTYDAEGNFTIYNEDYEKLKQLLGAQAKGAGYMTQEFGITVVYREDIQNVTIVDKLRGCRITSEDHSLSTGNNAIVIKVGLSIMEIIANGQKAVGAMGAVDL